MTLQSVRRFLQKQHYSPIFIYCKRKQTCYFSRFVSASFPLFFFLICFLKKITEFFVDPPFTEPFLLKLGCYRNFSLQILVKIVCLELSLQNWQIFPDSSTCRDSFCYTIIRHWEKHIFQEFHVFVFFYFSHFLLQGGCKQLYEWINSYIIQ